MEKKRKKYFQYTKFFIVFVSSIICIIFPAFALPSTSESPEEKGYSVKVKTNKDKGINIQFKLKDYSINKLRAHGKNFTKITLKGANISQENGKPALPFITILFGIPASGTFDVVQNNLSKEEKFLPFLAPVQSIPLSIDTFNNNLNTTQNKISNSFYPKSVYLVKDMGYLRDHRIASLNIYPFRYNSFNKTLRITKQIDLSINFHKDTRLEGTIRVPEKNSPFEVLFSRLVINYQQCKLWLKPHPAERTLYPFQANDVYKIVTNKEGIYQITYSDLASAGINPADINPLNIHISNKGYEIPIYVKGEDDSIFNNDDYIEFFAKRIRGDETYFNPYTDENVYLLSFQDSLGKRIVEEDGTVNDSINCIVQSSFEDTTHFEKDSIFIRLSQTTADSTDIWFWKRLYGPDTQNIDIKIPYPDTLSNFGITIMLHGYTTTSAGHKLDIYWNNSFLGHFTWSGQTPYKINLGTLSGNILKTSNTLTLIVPSPADSVDGFFLNWFEVYYKHKLYAENNKLTFKTPKQLQDSMYEFRLNNFDFADVEIYKNNVSKIINFKRETYEDAGRLKYRFIFQDNDLTNLMKFTAIPIWQKLKPMRIEKVQSADLLSPLNRAEYLIITSDSLKNSANDYALWKTSQGFDCMVVTTDDIYNEFNYGIASPEAIKTFIKYAYDYYTQPPVYCLLFGDGTYDYKGLTGNFGNFVPVHLSWYWGLWGPVADDEYYARVSENDYLPDIFIGRFPIRTNNEFNGLFEKEKNYLDYKNLDEWKKNFLFVADSGTAGYNSYPDMENIIKNYIPPDFDVSRCYHPRKAREDFLKEIDKGSVFVNFLSHGGGDVLCGGDFLISKDIYRMTNYNRLPFWTAFSCVNGFFAEPNKDSISIGETVFLAPNGGGIGYYGPGSLTYGGDNYYLSKYIYDGIFNQNLLQFGQFLSYGEITYYTTFKKKYQLMTYNLLGDPGIKLVIPDSTKINIELYPPSLSAGDTLNINGTINGSPDGEIIVTSCAIKDSLVIPFNKITFPVTAGNFSGKIITPDTLSPGKGIVKAYFRGTNEDGTGHRYFNIEQPNIFAVSTIPTEPTKNDSVRVKACIFDPDSIIQSSLKWRKKGVGNWTEITMQPSQLDTFITSSSIPPEPAGTTIEYKIYAVDSLGNCDTSYIYSYHIQSLAELSFAGKNIYLDGDTSVTLNVAVQNTGETRADSFRVGFFDLAKNKKITVENKFSFKMLNPDTIGFDTLSLGCDSTKIATVNFNLPFGKYNLYAIIDPDNWVEESNKTNNSSLDSITHMWVDHFLVTPDSGTIVNVQSSDSVLHCYFPPNAVSSKCILTIASDTSRLANFEPDITPIPINGDTQRAYYIALSKDVLIDSFLMQFALKDTLSFSPSLYLWLKNYKKWTTVGKLLQDSIYYQKKTSYCGLYSLFFNNDSIPPAITSKIDNKHFNNETIYENKIKVSAVITDRNGIDIEKKKIILVLNGDTVNTKYYTYSKYPDDIRALPLKFSKQLDEGAYTLIISAFDVNGNMGSDTITFNVSVPFNISGIGNYPNPVYLDSTIFTYHLSKEADKTQLQIFTSGGKLIKEFTNHNVSPGYHEICWDLKDNKKRPVANGVYFYRFTATLKNEKKSKTFKMAILR